MAEQEINTTSSRAMSDRYVLIVGKSGAGKSTVANKILQSPAEPAPFNVSAEVIVSDTQQTKSHTTLLETDSGDYRVEVIDTQGFFDNRPGATNEMILSGIKKYISDRIPRGLNVIIFVFKHGRWAAEEQKMFEYVTKNFKDEISSISALVITGCDNLKDEEKEKIKEDFKEKYPSIGTFMKNGIYTVAFPDVSRLMEAFKQLCLKEQEKDQETLRRLVYSSEALVLTTDMIKPNFSDKLRSCVVL